MSHEKQATLQKTDLSYVMTLPGLNIAKRHFATRFGGLTTKLRSDGVREFNYIDENCLQGHGEGALRCGSLTLISITYTTRGGVGGRDPP